MLNISWLENIIMVKGIKYKIAFYFMLKSIKDFGHSQATHNLANMHHSGTVKI